MFSSIKKYLKVYTDVKGLAVAKKTIAELKYIAAQAIASSAAGVHASIATNASTLTTVTTAITAPPCARNITATVGGTDANIKATQVIITGTNINDEVITESLPAFTVDTAGIVSGAKAFKTVTKIEIPAQDGAGVTVTIGFGDLLGVPYILERKSSLKAFFNNTVEAVATETFGATLELNTFSMTSALNGSPVEIYLLV